MQRNALLLAAGLAVALVIVVFGKNDAGNQTPEAEQSRKNFSEYSSILWKAQVYDSKIDFVADERVIHTLQFGISERHVDSVSYRNLNGYFDPVFVSVWKQGQKHKALIVDPLSKTTLVEVHSELEIDISVSDDNRIVISYSKAAEGDDSAAVVDDRLVWPG